MLAGCYAGVDSSPVRFVPRLVFASVRQRRQRKHDDADSDATATVATRFRYRNLTKHSFGFAWRLTAETATEAESTAVATATTTTTAAATASHYYAFAAMLVAGASCGESKRMGEYTKRECVQDREADSSLSERREMKRCGSERSQ